MPLMFQILIIDDDVESCEILQKNLVRLGCEVTIANTAEDGIEQLERIKYDAVFAALCVRNMGGRGIARWVKERSNGTKVFIMTSWKGDLEPNLLKLDGINDVIHKPLKFWEVHDKILKHLG